MFILMSAIYGKLRVALSAFGIIYAGASIAVGVEAPFLLYVKRKKDG